MAETAAGFRGVGDVGSFHWCVLRGCAATMPGDKAPHTPSLALKSGHALFSNSNGGIRPEIKLLPRALSSAPGDRTVRLPLRAADA
jgi:hypothetical protein